MKIIVLALGCLLVLTSVVKPRLVDVEEELQKATFVGEIVALRYSGTHMYYHKISSPKTIDSTTCFGKVAYAGYDGGYLTATWPQPYDTVIAVMDSNRVSLFAQILKNDYRFWSPNFTGSIAYFNYNAPFRKLDGEKEDTYSDKKATWDGVMLEKGELGKWRRD